MPVAEATLCALRLQHELDAELMDGEALVGRVLMELQRGGDAECVVQLLRESIAHYERIASIAHAASEAAAIVEAAGD